MRRMYSPEELKRLVKEVVQAGNLSISGDIEFENDVSIGGDLAVTGSINGEENPSVKPIYWHSLDIYKAGKTLLRAVILNNSNTPIDSIPKKQQYHPFMRRILPGLVPNLRVKSLLK